MKTTLNKIRAKGPCADGWEKLLKNLGKTKADDEPLGIMLILKSNGLDDALWCLRAVEGRDKELRWFAAECARSIQHLTAGKKSLVAGDAAMDAALDAAPDAAARSAAWAANRATFVASAARAAARAAVGAERVAAGDAARNAARDAQANLLILVCNGCFD